MKGAGKDENKRAPMYWSSDPDAEGMCAGPAGMDEIKMRFPSLEEQRSDGSSVYNFVVQALRLRAAYPAVSHGQAVFLEELSDADVCVLEKQYEDQCVLLAFNISPEARTVDLALLEKTPVLSGALVTTAESPVLEGEQLTLPMYSVALLTYAAA